MLVTVLGVLVCGKPSRNFETSSDEAWPFFDRYVGTVVPRRGRPRSTPDRRDQ